jgi:hypothetical protein
MARKAKTPPQDFLVANHGTVWTIVANTEAAIEFAHENFAIEPWMGTAERFTTDHRPARNLVENLIREGFNVGGFH